MALLGIPLARQPGAPASGPLTVVDEPAPVGDCIDMTYTDQLIDLAADLAANGGEPHRWARLARLCKIVGVDRADVIDGMQS